MVPSGFTAVCIHPRALLHNHQEVDQQAAQPEFAEHIKVTPGMSHCLHEPQTTVHGCKHACVQREVHNPAEVPVPGIRGVTGAVPADGHW